MAITIVLTVLLVAAASALHFEMLRLLYFELPRLPLAGRLAGKHRVGIGVAGAMVAHTLEILLFGLGHWAALKLQPDGLRGAFDGSLWSCVYYAAVTYTSLGLGDIAPVGEMQFMTGMTALTGLVLIAWTASFTFLLMQRYWGER
jgi:p-aminobenzoyl-glutamate transporter AbgT